MIVAALFFCALFGTSARMETNQARVRIGEPFVITFVVEHDTGATVKLPETSLIPRQFAFVSDLGLAREIDPAHPDTTTTRARWSVMALEGGEVEFPPLDVGIEGNGVNQVLHAAGPKLTVEHALKDDEDAPRPARGFRDAPDVRAAGSKLAWIAVGLLGITLAYIGYRLTRRVKKPTPAPTASGTERLRELEQRVNSEPERAREHVYALTAILRAAVDAHVSENRAALSDEDWARATSVDSRVPEAARGIAAQLLCETERVKYAGETPSILALRDILSRANTALAELSPPQRTAA